VQEGNPGPAIPVLEQLLRDNGFPAGAELTHSRHFALAAKGFAAAADRAPAAKCCQPAVPW